MLSEIFTPTHIKLDLESTTKADVFEELIETIADDNAEFDRQELLEAVTMRENKMATIIKPGIAIPHGYSRTISGIIGAIGFSRAGIEYDQIDCDPVHLFFMLLMDESSREQHLQVFGHLWDLLNSAAFSDEIRKLRTPQEVYSLLSRF